VSDFIRDRLRQAQPAHAQRIQTLYNGVNTDRFRPAAADPGNHEQRIVFAGRLSPEKGPHTLIEAFASIADRHPGLILDIAGPDEVIPADMQLDLTDDPEVARLKPFYEPGAYRAHLQKLIDDRGLADRVKFHGVLDHAGGLVELLQRATMAVVPSIWDEPFGLPVIEAMACGAPVVATRVGAFPELVEEGKTGLLVSRANPDELGTAIEKLLENDATRREMSQASRQRAVQVFSWDKVVDELREYYRTTIETRAARPPHLVAR
jgi:glycosyltransferase involved in cell wall biosynthesis